MGEPVLGQVNIVGFNFAPRGWAFCNGQLLPIAQNDALFSLLGTTFGGDGRSTMGLPDLRGRSAVHVGTGPGLSPIAWGQKSGSESHTLRISEIPSHNHFLQASSDLGDTAAPSGAVLANTKGLDKEYKTSLTSPVTMNANTVGNSGGGQSFGIRNPYLGMYTCIAVIGQYPSRS